MWIQERTAGTQLGWAGLPAVLFLWLLAWGARGEEAGEEASKLRAALDIRGALQFEFFAARGMVYTVAAQAAEGSWEVIYGPVYGDGETVADFVSGAAGYVAYRLEVGVLGELGLAPTDLGGHAYSLNDGVRFRGMDFLPGGRGQSTAPDGLREGFSYTYEKRRPDVGGLEVEYDSGLKESLSLTFAPGRVGSFESSSQRGGGQRARRTSGTFRAGSDVDPRNAAPPQTLEGARFLVRDRGMVTLLTFTTDFSGSLLRQGGEPEVISYSYAVTSGTEAQLTVAPADTDETHEYALVFGARNSGGFVRHIIRGGRSEDTDRGKFSGKGSGDRDDDGKGVSRYADDCLAPQSLVGRTLQANVGGQVVTILLNGAGTGNILRPRPHGRVALQAFTYTYSKETDTEGLLTITLPTGSGEEVQHYKLDFTTRKGGTCVRKRFESGELEGTDEGPFTLSDDDGDLAAADLREHHDGHDGHDDDDDDD